jgi:multidrug efflux system outer membrane protein
MSAALEKRVGQVVGGILLALLALLVVGCKVGPNYKRPVVDVPDSYRQALAPDIAPASSAPSIADAQWTTVFQDPVLQSLIQQALANNLDLRIAAERVLEAQAQVGITRSQQLPSISGGAGYSAIQIPSTLAGQKVMARSPTPSLAAESRAHPPDGTWTSGDSTAARAKPRLLTF